MKRISVTTVACMAVAMVLCGSSSASAQASLGAAQSFAVLGASTVTNTGLSIVTGNLGVSPGTSITGFPPGVLIGTKNVADGAAGQAHSDAAAAFVALGNRPCDTTLTGIDLGGLTLPPGVYCFAAEAQLTGGLLLDAMGSTSAEFVFKIGSTLTTAAGASVAVINGGSGCNVYWQVGTSATFGLATSFTGNVLASASATLTTGAAVSGRVLALNGAVTMDTNSVSLPPECACATGATVTDLGPGCGNPAAPILTSSPPVIGQPVVLTITSVFPSTMVVILLSDCGSSPFVIAGTSCPVYVDLATLSLVVMDMTDTAGAWTLTYAVPPNSIAGRCFRIQGVVWSANGPFAGDNLSNGLEVTIGCY